MTFSSSAMATTIGVALLAIGSQYLYFRAGSHTPARSGAALESVVAAPPRPVEETHDSVTFAPNAILIKDGMLSLELHEQSLGAVLAEISRKSHVRIFSSPAIDNRVVTLQLHEVPLDRGLRELLRDCDVFFYNSAGELRSAWIYEKDAGAQLIPVPPENWASTADVARQMNSGSAAERISAIETLVARNGPDSGELVSRALLDENADVRLRTLDVALSAGVTLSRETLTSLTYDGSAAVRALALEAIANGTALGSAYEADTDDMLRRMTGDADAEVRAKAAEALEGRHTSN
jgi:hypothetical protein